MTPYAAVLFIHVTSAAEMFGAVGIMSILETMIRQADSLDRLRMLGSLAQHTAKVLMVPSLFLFASAVYLVHYQWDFRAP